MGDREDGFNKYFLALHLGRMDVGYLICISKTSLSLSVSPFCSGIHTDFFYRCYCELREITVMFRQGVFGDTVEEEAVSDIEPVFICACPQGLYSSTNVLQLTAAFKHIYNERGVAIHVRFQRESFSSIVTFDCSCIMGDTVATLFVLAFVATWAHRSGIWLRLL